MRNYFLDVIKRIRKYNQELDVKDLLCKSSWIVFNDKHEKEVFIFKENGELLVSVNGEIDRAKWEFIPNNSSLILSVKDREIMIKPEFVFEEILAFKLDGVESYIFLMDEIKLKNHILTLSELNEYFLEIERKNQIEEIQKQQEIEKQQLIEAQEEKRRLIVENWMNENSNIIKQIRKSDIDDVAFWGVILVPMGGCIGICLNKNLEICCLLFCLFLLVTVVLKKEYCKKQFLKLKNMLGDKKIPKEVLDELEVTDDKIRTLLELSIE